MSKENPLSHHEQLRYDYLLKNIYYLNEREKEEFAYLQDKLNSANNDATLESQELIEDYSKTSANASIPSYNNRSRSERYQKINSLSKKKLKSGSTMGPYFRRFTGYLSLSGIGYDFYVLERLYQC